MFCSCFVSAIVRVVREICGTNYAGVQRAKLSKGWCKCKEAQEAEGGTSLVVYLLKLPSLGIPTARRQAGTR